MKNRPDPQGNPVTFISCTNEDESVEWMKECEEVAPFCAECDDFNDEAREILRDQGPVLPYTHGFHLICRIVAAMCPHDLDAMVSEKLTNFVDLVKLHIFLVFDLWQGRECSLQ